MIPELIVEIGNTHEGSVGIAKSFVDLIKASGAKIAKFQMHLAEFESSPQDTFRVKFSDQDNSRIEYWNRINFNDNLWSTLSAYCDSQQIEFMCTPFSIEAAQKLMRLTSIKRWKVGSGDAVNFPLLDFLIETEKPLIISTGLVTWEEILILKKRLINKGAWTRTTLMHCVSEYPTSLEHVSLHIIDELKSLGCRVGLSDHSGNISTALCAITKGIDLLEIHVKPVANFFGPDNSSSILPEDIEFLVNFISDFEIINSTKYTRNELFDFASSTARLFRKGVYARENLQKGKLIQPGDLAYLKPADGIDSIHFEKILGKKLVKDIKKHDKLGFDDFE